MPARKSSRPARRTIPAEDDGVARPLATYQRKRDFTTSPEPSGRQAVRRGTGRYFCIQKHLASHLHYDFRLEHRGVLLSWAVPKGPSADPRVKRLAMQVEDHPLAYGSFEGVIPSGYGAGIVLLWDRGVWQPLVDDVDAALARGNLPFLVLAEKLQGAWTLVRTGRGGRPTWLLIKQRDAWASSRDLTRAKPASVASHGDFADILARIPDPWAGGPPVGGGETGALFRAILAKAKRLRLKRPVATKGRRREVRAAKGAGAGG